MPGRAFAALVFFTLLSFAPVHAASDSIHPDGLPSGQRRLVNSILEKLSPLIEAKKGEGSAALLTFDEFYAPLTPEEKSWVDALRAVDPASLGVKTPYLGFAAEEPVWKRLEGQTIVSEGREKRIETQFLPETAFRDYERMMAAMEKDLSRRLWVESGYRSPAYQLYLFVFYLVQHDYSVRETARWNAFPGYSEHGFPGRQAVDFITADGVSGEESPELFEAREEYAWLLKRAGEFGFYLSYPKANPQGIAFEPWHWHHRGEAVSGERGA